MSLARPGLLLYGYHPEGCVRTLAVRPVLALLLDSYMPETSARLLAALGEKGRRLAAFGSRPGGSRVERIAPLFPKLA